MLGVVLFEDFQQSMKTYEECQNATFLLPGNSDAQNSRSKLSSKLDACHIVW